LTSSRGGSRSSPFTRSVVGNFDDDSSLESFADDQNSVVSNGQQATRLHRSFALLDELDEEESSGQLSENTAHSCYMAKTKTPHIALNHLESVQESEAEFEFGANLLDEDIDDGAISPQNLFTAVDQSKSTVHSGFYVNAQNQKSNASSNTDVNRRNFDIIGGAASPQSSIISMDESTVGPGDFYLVDDDSVVVTGSVSRINQYQRNKK
jgi:hypothetical protein